MLIQSIRAKGDSFAVIDFTTGDSLTVKKDIVYDLGLRKGEDISEEVYLRLIFENNFSKAKETSLRYLAMRAHSGTEIKLKLMQKKYEPEIIGEVLTHLKEYDLINDEKFARDYFIDCVIHRKMGIEKFKAMAYKKGLKPELISRVVSELQDNESQVASAISAARKKMKSLQSKEYDYNQLKIRIGNHLFSKGFGYDVIKEALHEVLSENIE